jgi:hypothetical protein
MFRAVDKSEKVKNMAEFLDSKFTEPALPAADYFEHELLAVADEEFCKGVLASKQYRESILRRVLTDSLPSSVETMIWERAHGKVVMRLAGASGGPIEMVTEVRRVIVRAKAEEETFDEPIDSESYATH